MFGSLLGFEDLDVINPDGSRAEEAHVDANDVSVLCCCSRTWVPCKYSVHGVDCGMTCVRACSCRKEW